MVVSAQHFREVTNGYEQTSSGLWTHKGGLQAGALRATGPLGLISTSGPGVNVQYDPSGNAGYIQAYDYSTGAWKDLVIAARNMNISTTGGTLSLPAGSVSTAAIAAGAVTGVVSYQIASGFVASTAAWTETDVRATGTFTGSGMVLVFWSTCFSNPNTGGGTYIGVGIDGAANTVGLVGHSGGSLMQFGGCFTTTGITAGSHRVSIFVYPTAGATTLSTQAYSTVAALELRR